jgi:hypothetical protein
LSSAPLVKLSGVLKLLGVTGKRYYSAMELEGEGLFGGWA